MSDVVVVGGGYAGLKIALMLKRDHRISVTICEREHEGHDALESLRIEAAQAGVSFLTDTMAISLTKLPDRKFEVNTIGVRGPQAMPATAVVLATGARERTLSARYIAGSQASGVFTGIEIERALSARQRGLGRMAVVLGADARAYDVVESLAKIGIRTRSLITPWKAHQVSWWRNILSRLRHFHRVRTNSYITQVEFDTDDNGSDRVSGISVVNREGQISALACDTVVVTGDWVSEYEVALRSGILLDRRTKGPAVDTAGRTSRRGVFATGAVVQPAYELELTNVASTASAVADYVKRSVWPEAIAIDYADPIDWVEPAFLGKGHHFVFPEFVVCLGNVTSKSTIQVRQGLHLLAEYQVPHDQLQPGLPFVMAGQWIAHVDPQGPEIMIRLV